MSMNWFYNTHASNHACISIFFSKKKKELQKEEFYSAEQFKNRTLSICHLL